MSRILSYLWRKKRYPGFEDFLNMGLGIEARERRCRRFWAPHLSLSKNFLTESLQSLPYGYSAAILGAGRLLDIPLLELESKAKRIQLCDADPGTHPYWKKWSRSAPANLNLIFEHGDLTGCLKSWTATVSNWLENNSAPRLEEFAALINSLQLSNTRSLVLESDIVLSVNILSQIPIYWRDRVVRMLACHWGLETDEKGDLPEPIQSTLQLSFAKLQQAHLEQIASSARHKAVILTDLYFYYYSAELPNWQVEEALYLDKIDLHDYSVAKRSSWLWHLAPQFIEAKSYGEIHEVHAFDFVRNFS